ncbi:MAG: hypothetical protein IPP74_14545 [Alphaproteobacteria bacterium]|nr:hypothetical protein [Alphaproteobacteria bacterium]
MSDARLDENGRYSMTGLLDSDGATITRVTADPTNHGLSADDNTTGSDNGGDYAHLDDNYRPTMYALSSADGTTRVSLYVDSTGHLLIDSS